MAQRANTQLLAIQRRGAIGSPLATAEGVNAFLGGGLDVAKMAAAIDPSLYRIRK